MRSPAAVAVAVAAAYLLFVAARLLVLGGDPSGFVTAGDGITDPAAAPDSLQVVEGVRGYDGQAYYRLARDPLTRAVEADGIAFYRPAYWQARIGYPATAWLLSGGGRAPLVPLALLAVNLVAVVALAAVAARLARRLGRSPWWGAVPAMWAGFLVGVGQDLTEPLAGLLLLGALAALHVARPAAATVALTAAALTRETTLVVAVAVLLAGLAPSGRRADRPPWWVGAVPLAAYAGWRTWVRTRWSDVLPHPPPDNPLGLPLAGLAGDLAHATTRLDDAWPGLVLLLPTLAALAVVGSALGERGGPAHLRLALAGYLLVLACLPVWDRGQAYLRWGCEPVLLGWLLLVARPRPRPAGRDRALPALAVLTTVVWLVAATQAVAYPRVEGPWAGVWTWS